MMKNRNLKILMTADENLLKYFSLILMPFFLEKNKVLFNTALMLFGGSRVFSLNFSLYYTDLSKMLLIALILNCHLDQVFY